MTISISDEELSHLVKAWPKLEALTLSHYVSWMNKSTHIPRAYSATSLCAALLVSLVIDTTKVGRHRSPYPGGGICNKISRTSTRQFIHRVSTKYRSYAQVPSFPTWTGWAWLLGKAPMNMIREGVGVEQWR